jgi:hypothetical protein
MSARAILARLLVVVALVATAAAQAAAGGAGEDGAPRADGWTTDGGCPARTATSSERPLEGPVEAAWMQKVAGEVGSEPVVLGSWLAVDSEGRNQRTLSLHQLSDGRAVATRTFRNALPLLPCVAEGVLYVRSAPSAVTALRWRAPVLSDTWTVDAGAPIESLVAFGREVYVRTATRVARYDLGVREPKWTVEGRPRGRLALRGPHVYFVDYAADGGATLQAVLRTNGAVAATVKVGHHEGTVPARPVEDPAISVHEKRVLVLHGLDVPTKNRRSARVYEVSREVAASGALRLLDPALIASVEEPLGLPDGWIVAARDDDGPYLYQRRDGKEGSVLGTRGDHPEWLDSWSLASHAAGLVYHPAGVLALRDQRTEWRFAAPPVRRPVPVRGLVVVAESGGILRAYRRKSSGLDAALRAVGGGLGPVPADARMVLRDGSVVTGKVAFDAGGFTCASSPARKVAPADVLLVEDAGGRILHLGGADDLPGAFEVLTQDEAAAGAARVLAEAFQTRDPDLLRRTAAAASLLGAPRADLDRVDARLREILKPGGKPLKPEPELTAKLTARIDELRRAPVAAAADRLRKLPADAPADVRIDLLRTILRMDPSDAEATDGVRKLLPAHVSPPDPFDALEWLDFAEVAQRVPLKIHVAPPANDPNMTPAQRTVGIHAFKWRDDVVGIESPRILVVSPLRRPGALARCLSLGELACEALETMFAGGKPRRDLGQPLTIVLCETREEYMREVLKHGFTPLDDTFWSPGAYLPSEETAWVYLPDDDANFERVIAPFVHDLTFQWLDLRCPAFTFVEDRHNVRSKGMWAQSGLSVFVEELRFDLRRRTWELDPAAPATDVVAAAPPGRLLGWSKVYSLSSVEHDVLSDVWDIEIPGTRRLGQSYSQQRLYFDQAGATISYLWFADGGKWRPRLAEAVAAYYRNENPKVEAIFGCTADELGRRVTEWCRAQQAR